MLDRPSNGFWAGIVVSTAVVWALTLFDVHFHDEVDRTALPTNAAAARVLVADWQQMRAATWTEDSVFERVLDDGRSARSTIHEAQQPPRRMRSGMGVVDVWNEGGHRTCARVDDRVTGCHPTDGGGWADDTVVIEREVLGEGASYDVSRQGDRCFVLLQKPQLATGRWGTRATLCFDEATRALVRTEIERSGGVDRTTAMAVRPRVDVADFVVP
jgi:hypothetical protein